MKNLKRITVLGILSVITVGCSKETKPEDTLKQFFDEVAKKNFEQVDQITTPESAKNVSELKAASEEQNKPVEVRLENAKKLVYGTPIIKGDSAFIDISNAKTPKPMVYTLVKKDGKWLVDISPKSMKRMLKNQ